MIDPKSDNFYRARTLTEPYNYWGFWTFKSEHRDHGPLVCLVVTDAPRLQQKEDFYLPPAPKRRRK